MKRPLRYRTMGAVREGRGNPSPYSIDDVISTGRSLQALEEIAAAAGADVVGKMAVLAEGDAASRTDISYLEKLPLFNGKGEPLPFD